MSYKVLVSDKLGDAGVNLFEQEEGIEVDVKTDLSDEQLKEIIGDYDALAVRSGTKVTKELLESAGNLKAIGRAGIGVDNIDVDEATRRGIIVMNTPGGNVVTTAEHAISMMMALTRNIPQGTASLKDGRWDKKKLQGREIMNKTLGVIGFGKIGSIVANRARGLKMNVVVYDPVVTPENIKKEKCEPVGLNELYERSDYITIHVPKIKKTTNMIDKDAFAKMKDGVMLIHCARGGIVDEDALYDALKMGKVGGAALDVFTEEPPPEGFKLFEFDNVICTPHLGASTAEAQTNVAVDIAHQLIGYLKDETIKNAVNVPSVSGKVLEELDPFIRMADRIGRMLAQLSDGHIRSVEIDYDGDFGDHDLSPVRTAVLCGMLEPLVLDDVNAVNAPYLAKEKGIKVLESSSGDAQEFINLITVTVKTEKETNVVSGTLFGKSDPRIVRINDFRLEMRPEGYLTLIQNMDIPGEIGSIGTILGDSKINIARMTVGQEEPEGERNIVFLRTDTPLTKDVLQRLENYPRTRQVIYMDL
ncbi:MAG: phosphoglycerate dehydrogenase [Desulfobacterales bacterium]|nr:phosphoglycerate dehydrogenase [Desulfobacterales bacterium]